MRSFARGFSLRSALLFSLLRHKRLRFFLSWWIGFAKSLMTRYDVYDFHQEVKRDGFVAQDTAVRRLEGVECRLCSLHVDDINSIMVALQVNVRTVLLVGVLVQRRDERELHRSSASAFDQIVLVQELLTLSTPRSLNSRDDAGMLRNFSFSLMSM